MIKNKSIIKAAILIFILCFINSGCSVINISNGGSNMFLKSETINETKNEDIGGINEIYIGVVSSEVNVIPEKRDDVKVHYYGKITANSTPKLDVSTSGRKLIIKERYERNSINISDSSLKVDVFIPTAYSKNIMLNASSGDINIQNEMKVKNISIETSSGDVCIDGLSAEEIDCQTSSGEFKGMDIDSKIASISSSSGDIKIENFNGDLRSHTSSGCIKLSYREFKNKINMRSSSGDIEISLPRDSKFNFNAQTSSGDINTDFPIAVMGKQRKNSLAGTVGSSENSIEVRTSSGDVTIRIK